MLPLHPLATAVQADREREMRSRRLPTPAVATGRRHPSSPGDSVGCLPSQGRPATTVDLAGSR
jgi:hypothetical protein